MNAPDGSQKRSCAPSPIGEPSSTWSTRPRNTYGRANRHVHVGRRAQARLDPFGQGDRGFGRQRIQLPVAGDQQGAHETGSPSQTSIVLPSRSASCRSSSISRAYWSGTSAWGPSERAFSGHECTST